MKTALFTVYLALFLILIGTCYRKSWKAWHVPAKCANSAGFIALLLAGLTLRGNSAFIYSLLPPFLLCFLGDFFLALCQGKDSRVLLLGGLASFLTAHILFIVCFLNLSAFHWTDLIISSAAVAVTWGLTRLKGMHVKDMLPYVLCYAFFVGLLFSKGLLLAAACRFASGTAWIAAGAFLFFISDGIILFLYFYDKQWKLGKFFNLLFYYGGMLCLALSGWQISAV